MILVMAGTHWQPFDRLIKNVDELVGEKKIKNVVVQIGYSTYKPRNIKNYFRFLEFSKMEKLIKRADLVITHGGIGSILLSLKYKKPTVIVPRLSKYNEHTDDHQLQVSKELEREGRALIVYDIDDLEKCIRMAKKLKAKKGKKSKIIEMIKNYLDKIGE